MWYTSYPNLNEPVPMSDWVRRIGRLGNRIGSRIGSWIADIFTISFELLSALVWLITLILGPACAVYGIWLIYPPAAWITGGLLIYIARCGGLHPAVKLFVKLTEKER